MSHKRRYQLLCPIARALDVLGDRWALLILRDLHAGPARFHELQEGLGTATNLLTTRLAELSETAGWSYNSAGLASGRICCAVDRYEDVILCERYRAPCASLRPSGG